LVRGKKNRKKKRSDKKPYTGGKGHENNVTGYRGSTYHGGSADNCGHGYKTEKAGGGKKSRKCKWKIFGEGSSKVKRRKATKKCRRGRRNTRYVANLGTVRKALVQNPLNLNGP